MVILLCVLKNIGLYLVILPFLQKILASNTTEKNLSESFVVSANYGVQSGNTKPTAPSHQENFDEISPNSFLQYKGFTDNSLFVNNNYQDYSKSYFPTSEEQRYEEHLESSKQDDIRNESNLKRFLKREHETYRDVSKTEVLPTPSEWKGDFVTSSYLGYEVDSQSNADSYHPLYASYENTKPNQQYQESAMTYLDKSQAKSMYNVHNNLGSNFQAENTKSNDVIYGSSNADGTNTLWANKNSKTSNDRAYETQDNWFTANQNSINENVNDFHRPSIKELQDMISKIVKGTSRVHQVVKVPAVYEIHLQEEEKPFDTNSIKHTNTFNIPVPDWSTDTKQTWKQHNPVSFKNRRENYGQRWNSQVEYSPRPEFLGSRPSQWENAYSSPKQWRNNRISNSPRPWSNPHFSSASQPSTKTWNLPTKLKYFDNAHSPSEIHSSSSGKYSYPKPFTSNGWSTGSNNQNPSQQWHVNRPNIGGRPMYGSVSVPMTPGSTKVTFHDYSPNPGYQNNIYGSTSLNTQEIKPDLSRYYAKKKEIENNRLRENNQHNRREGIETSLKKKYRKKMKRSEEMPALSLNNLNYIIHVREKSNR